jgi:hypothetical protein
MSITPQATEEREALLGELFSKWLEALESGQRPNREDWLAQYPEYASELEEWIAEEERMRPSRYSCLLGNLQSIDAESRTSAWRIRGFRAA